MSEKIIYQVLLVKLTFEITVRSASEEAIPLTISIGVVSYEVPSTVFPSGKVTVIGFLSLEANSASAAALSLSQSSRR